MGGVVVCGVMCVYYSVRRICFQRLADRTNLPSETRRSDNYPALFFVLCSFQPNCWTLGVLFIKLKHRISASNERVWCLWTNPMMWLLTLSFTKFTEGRSRVFCILSSWRIYCRSVTPLDAARVNRTIFHNHSVHRHYITRIEGRDYIKHDIIIWHGQQNRHGGRWL